jgi:WD40 repeat protein
MASGSAVAALALTPDGRFAAVGMEIGSVKLWDLSAGTIIRSFDCPEGEAVTSVTISSALPLLAAGCSNGSVWLWDLASGQQMRNLLAPLSYEPSLAGVFRPPVSVQASPNGRTVVTGVTDQLVLWDLLSGRELRRITVGEKASTVSPTSSQTFEPSKSEVIAQGGRLTKEEAEKCIQALAVHSNGHIAVVSRARGVTLWDLQTGQQIIQFTNDPSLSSGLKNLNFTPDGRLLIGTSAKFAVVWDVATGKQLQWVESSVGKVSKGSKGGAVSSDGRFGARVEQNTIEVWDIATGQDKFSFPGHEPSTTALGFTPNGRVLVSGGGDGVARLWDLQSGREIAALISIGRAEYATVTPDHFYRASKSSLKGMSSTMSDQLLNRPDIVQQRLSETFLNVLKE